MLQKILINPYQISLSSKSLSLAYKIAFSTIIGFAMYTKGILHILTSSLPVQIQSPLALLNRPLLSSSCPCFMKSFDSSVQWGQKKSWIHPMVVVWLVHMTIYSECTDWVGQGDVPPPQNGLRHGGKPSLLWLNHRCHCRILPSPWGGLC